MAGAHEDRVEYWRWEPRCVGSFPAVLRDHVTHVTRPRRLHYSSADRCGSGAVSWGLRAPAAASALAFAIPTAATAPAVPVAGLVICSSSAATSASVSSAAASSAPSSA